MRGLTSLILAFGLIGGVAGAQVRPTQRERLIDRTVPVEALIGLDPAAVQARLLGEAKAWPVQPALSFASERGVVSFVPAEGLIWEPAERERMGRFAQNDFSGPRVAAFTDCQTAYGREGGGSVTFQFRDERLEAVLRYGPATPADFDMHPMRYDPSGGYRANTKIFDANRKMPQPNPYAATAGDLPLDDGLGFMGRWRQTPLVPLEVVHMTCDRVTIPPPPAPRRQSRSDYNMQGLIGLPFVPAMPFINGRRTSAARNGRETLAALKLGESLSGGADGFAHGHSGVRVLRGDAPDYQVMTIDLGSVANNNLDNSDDVALVGVRAGRVEWIAPSVERGQGVPALFGSNVLCLDRGSVAGKARPGCNTYGRYAP